MEKSKEKVKWYKSPSTILDIFVYIVCCAFLTLGAILIGKKAIQLWMEEPIVKYYFCGVLVIAAVCLSIANIGSFNRKYISNDSDSSKRQNDFLFESDIRREEGRYSDRRNVVE
jgi:hypothetical protein